MDEIEENNYLDDLFNIMMKKSNNLTKSRNHRKKYRNILNNEDNENNYDEVCDNIGVIIDGYFNETQFHNDYRDTLTAFNNVAPAQKQLFNKSNFPVKFINPTISEVKDLIKSFIKTVNANIKHEVGDTINGNSGWDELMPEQKVKSGWEKQQEELGLPCSIYNEPAKKSRVKLLKVDHIEKYATDEQIRYVVFLYLQKEHVKDQMIVRVSFVLDNNYDERKILNTESETNNKNINVQIEEIFVLGYMMDTQFGSTTKVDDFYNFENIENDGIFDQEAILKQLDDKYKKRHLQTNEMITDVSDPIIGLSQDTVNKIAKRKLRKRH